MATRKLLPQFVDDGDENWDIESIVSVPNSFTFYNTLDEAGAGAHN